MHNATIFVLSLMIAVLLSHLIIRPIVLFFKIKKAVNELGIVSEPGLKELLANRSQEDVLVFLRKEVVKKREYFIETFRMANPDIKEEVISALSKFSPKEILAGLKRAQKKESEKK